MKMFWRTTVLVATIVGFAGQAANASRNGLNDCTCLTAAIGTSDTLGNITLVNGNVLYSGNGGFERATPGVQLISGSQISVSGGASADISVGKTCNLALIAGSDATISQPGGLGGEICVKVSDPLVTATSTQAPSVLGVSPLVRADIVGGAFGASGSGRIPLVPLAVVGGATGLAVLLGGGDAVGGEVLGGGGAPASP